MIGLRMEADLCEVVRISGCTWVFEVSYAVLEKI